MRRYRKLIAALSFGGITLGWLQAWEMINFSDIWAGLLTTLLAALATILFGGDATTFFA